MTKWNHEALSFARCRRRRVWADFSGSSISSNGGAWLLREVDRKLGLTDRVARAIGDRRQRTKVRHEAVTMVRQRPPRTGALRPRTPPRLENALPRPPQLLRSALPGHLRPVSVWNMRHEMRHYVQTTKTVPSCNIRGRTYPDGTFTRWTAPASPGMVRMIVRLHVPNPHVPERRSLNSATGQHPVRVVVHQQRQLHLRVVLRRATAALVHPKSRQRHHLDHKMHNTAPRGSKIEIKIVVFSKGRRPGRCRKVVGRVRNVE